MYSLLLFFWGFLEGSIVHTALCGCCTDRKPGSHHPLGFIPCPSPLLSQAPWKISLNLQCRGLIEKEYGRTGVFTAVKFAFAVCQVDYSCLIFITLICSVNNMMYLSLGVLHLVDISLFIYKKKNKTKLSVSLNHFMKFIHLPLLLSKQTRVHFLYNYSLWLKSIPSQFSYLYSKMSLSQYSCLSFRLRIQIFYHMCHSSVNLSTCHSSIYLPFYKSRHSVLGSS